MDGTDKSKVKVSLFMIVYKAFLGLLLCKDAPRYSLIRISALAGVERGIKILGGV